MGFGGVKWTEEENKIFIEKYSSTPKKELLKLFPGRSWTALVRRANKFKLKRKKELVHKMVLTKEQCLLIDRFYSQKTRQELQDLLPGVNWGTVNSYARRNGLNRPHYELYKAKFESEHDDLIKALYPKATKEEILKKIPFKWDTIVRRAERLGVKRNLSHIHLKNFISPGLSLQDFAIKNDIPLTSANKIFNKFGKEYLYEYIKSKNVNVLELRFKKLFENVLPIERWNRFADDVKRKPDYRIYFNNKVLYLNIDGVFYHNEKNSSSEYHLDLRKDFEEHNLRLMQFRSDELDDSSIVIKSIVCNYFNVNIRKIRASKCKIRAVSFEHSKKFFNQNHLMKFINRPTYGLYMNDELVAAISYQIRGKRLEIARFCSKVFTRVYGGFSKLLKHLISKFDPSLIVSFCDMRYSTGSSYLKVGFEYAGTTLGWRWTNGIRTYNRLKCRANLDERRLSEKEYAKEFKWVKIYDAGQSKYIMKLREDIEEKCEDSSFDDLSRRSNTKSNRFWTKEQKDLLKDLFNKGLSRSQIIQEFLEKHNKKTENAVIRKLSDLHLTRKRKTSLTKQ